MTTAETINELIRATRYPLLTQSAELTGIDYIRADFFNGKCPLLYVYFVAKVLPQSPIPEHLTFENIRITELGDEESPFSVSALIYPDAEIDANLLIIELAKDSQTMYNTSTYVLELVHVSVQDHRLAIDPFFNRTHFIAPNVPAQFDCQPSNLSASQSEVALEVDYLAKDYYSFRQLMLNRLSVLAPQWQFDDPADVTTVIVEVLAYAADQLSYYQDAVATEAYLSTARRRVSIKRHARLLDYRMHEGCNARVWVQIRVKSAAQENVLVPAGAQFKTKSAGMIFETLYPFSAVYTHNEFWIYAWGANEFALIKGATSATLYGDFPDLQADMVLIIEDRATTNTTRRHAIRLLAVNRDSDLINPTATKITHITWHSDDALPFDFLMTIDADQRSSVVMSGNIVLADHGASIHEETLQPDSVREHEMYRPTFKQRDLTFRVPFSLPSLQKQAASISLLQNVHAAHPVDAFLYSRLVAERDIWQAKADLLNSGPDSTDFVVEIENNRQAFIRFGDGVYGKQPASGTHFLTQYRVGNGNVGNIGAEALADVVDSELASKISIRNPLPAQGGTDPESIEQVRLYAPQVFKTQERCVTLQDYVSVIERHPKVKKAAAIQRWTGSWNTIFIAIDQRNRSLLDTKSKNDLEQFLQPYQIMSQEIAIIPPQFVPLDISLAVHVKPDFNESVVQRNLLDRFSDRILPSGQRGFFYPENFSFGNSVYWSQVIDAALSVAGVDWIDVNSKDTWFRVLGSNSKQALQEGVIKISGIQIAQLKNDPTQNSAGIIQFHMEPSA